MEESGQKKKKIQCATKYTRQNRRKHTFEQVSPNEDKSCCAVWSESWMSAWRNFSSLAIQNMPCEDSDQTKQMLRLIWIFQGPEVIKLFSCSTQLSMTFVGLINHKLLTIVNSFLLNIAEHENFSANKYENANYYLIAEKNFHAQLSWPWKKFYNLGVWAHMSAGMYVDVAAHNIEKDGRKQRYTKPIFSQVILFTIIIS